MAITLFAAALRYLGLSQEEAAEMLGPIKVQSIKNMASGRSRVPDGIWDELSRFAKAREAEIARLRPYAVEDATFVLDTLDGAPPGFPCADSYVTTLAAAVLTSAKD